MKIFYIIHGKGYLLLDLDPRNLTLRTVKEQEVLFVKSFENCYKLDGLKGTVSKKINHIFASINYLLGKELSLRDDFECGFYVLIFVY